MLDGPRATAQWGHVLRRHCIWQILCQILYTDSDYLFGIFKLFFKPLFVEGFVPFNL